MNSLNDLSEIFSSVLYYISDYESRLTGVSSILTSTIKDIDSRFFMSLDFLEYYKEYPRYPIDYKVINNLGNYNLVSIYSVVQNDVKYLLDAIETSEVLALKSKMDKIPERDILQDYNLQTTYFTSIYQDLLSRDMYSGFLVDKTRRSYLFETFGHYVPMANKRSSLLFEYALYAIMAKNLRSCLRIYENAFNREGVIIPKNSEYVESFGKYISENRTSLADSLVRYIMEYTYKISEPSEKFLSGIVGRVSDKLLGLIDVFESMISIRDNIFVNIVLRGTENLNSYISAMIANSAADPENFNSDETLISPELIKSLKRFELGKEDEYEPINYKYITDKYSVQTFRQYLYLVYYYKSFPRKFLNVLQLSLLSYVTQKMVDRNQVIFNPNLLISYFRKILGTKTSKPGPDGINMDLLCEMLQEVLTPEAINEMIEEQKICAYTTRVEMTGHAEEIFNFDNPEFEKYTDELYDIIFGYLKETVQVEPYYEYYFNKKMIYWYLLGCVKRDIFQNKVFSDQEIQLEEIFRETLLESDAYNPESEKYAIKFNSEKMRTRTVQHIEGNISSIGKLFDNIIETAAEKKLHSENISYYFS